MVCNPIYVKRERIHRIVPNATSACRLLLFLLLLSACRGTTSDPRAENIEKRLSRIQPVSMEFDARALPSRKRELLRKLVNAGASVHEAYLRQYYPPGVAIRDSLASRSDAMSKNALRLVIRNGGPFDKLNDERNFLSDEPRQPGGGFYPADLTREEFERFCANNPDAALQLRSPYTIVVRDGATLNAIPFHAAYAEWVVPAARL
ncbi:MAG: hypothetical protein C4326_12515 [Ignavibacteria bacterium]